VDVDVIVPCWRQRHVDIDNIDTILTLKSALAPYWQWCHIDIDFINAMSVSTTMSLTTCRQSILTLPGQEKHSKTTTLLRFSIFISWIWSDTVHGVPYCISSSFCTFVLRLADSFQGHHFWWCTQRLKGKRPPSYEVWQLISPWKIIQINMFESFPFYQSWECSQFLLNALSHEQGWELGAIG
jgi:hypothetical protein